MGDEVMGAEHHYLNAVEAYDEGDVETAYEEAFKAVQIDPEHVDSWQLCAETSSTKGREAYFTSSSKIIVCGTKNHCLGSKSYRNVDAWRSTAH